MQYLVAGWKFDPKRPALEAHDRHRLSGVSAAGVRRVGAERYYHVVREPTDDAVGRSPARGSGVTNSQIDALPKLRAIVHFGVGYETTDVASRVRRASW